MSESTWDHDSPVKQKTVKLVVAASPLTTQLSGVRAKTGLLEIRMMCQSGVICLPMDLSVSFHYKNPTKRVDLVQSGAANTNFQGSILSTKMATKT
jgi:hypothetical protein